MFVLNHAGTTHTQRNQIFAVFRQPWKDLTKSFKQPIFCSCLKPVWWTRGGQVRVLGLSCFKMRRMVLHPEACTLVREWNLCTLSFEFYQTPTLRSAVIGNRSVWEFGCGRERGRMAMCGGNICFKATRGPCLCVWPCVSKVGLGSLPRTTRCPWHQQEDVTIKHSPIAPRKRAVLFPWITLAFTNTHHSQTHKLMLLCWAPYFLALGLWRSTGVHLSGLHDCSTGSVFQIRSCSLSHIPPLAARLRQLY